MRLNPILIAGVFLLGTTPIWSKPLVLSERELLSPPHRIIRTCCSFGSEVGIMAVPFFSVTEITSIEEIGPHKYLGDSQEGNGIIYTMRGGFIDLGHLRDQADWTAYLYTLILKNKNIGHIEQELGHEGGDKKLNITIPSDIDSNDAMLLAGRIAYDLSVWHEIATWFGASYIPMVPERFSSFSVEDAYSNLLGVTIGLEALKSELPYEEAMTKLLAQKLEELQVVKAESETYAAMEAVRNIWWTREKRLPNSKVLMERQMDVYSSVSPMLVPGWGGDSISAYKLFVPVVTESGVNLSILYQLEFRLNFKFPYKKIFPDETGRVITQLDFNTMIHRVEQEWRYSEFKAGPEINAIPQDTKKDKRIRQRQKQRNIS